MTKFEQLLDRNGFTLLDPGLVQDLRDVLEAWAISKICAKAEMVRLDNCCGSLDSVIDALSELRDQEQLMLDLIEEAASDMVINGI